MDDATALLDFCYAPVRGAMRTFLIAVVAATSLVGGLRLYAANTPISAGITFADEVFTRSPIVTAALGDPLAPAEIAIVKRVAREEIERAFAALRVRVVESPRAFWRVRVVPTVAIARNRARFNASGAAYGFGPLGGAGFVSFTALAVNAARYAPDGASRAQVVEAIGRGIGRSAVHEFAHMMMPDVPFDRDPDHHSYEHRSTARVSQYYGMVRWATAGPVLRERFGR
jgi:hypothetical protein